MHNFAHLTNMRPAMRPEDLPPGTPFAHLLGGNSNSPSRVEGWGHRTRSGGYVRNTATAGKGLGR
jgi:hypothetical protein